MVTISKFSYENPSKKIIRKKHYYHILFAIFS